MATVIRMAASATGISERVLLEQVEHPAGVDPARDAEASELGTVVAFRQRGLQGRLEHAPSQRSRLLERNRGRQRRHGAVRRFARSYEDELDAPGALWPGRPASPGTGSPRP